MIQYTNKSVSTGLTFKRFVKLHGADEELAKNPSAKMFREIVVAIGGGNVQLDLSSVTKEAATGRYRNGGINSRTYIMSLSEFFNEEVLSAKTGGETMVVFNTLQDIRAKFSKSQAALMEIVSLVE